MHHFLLVGQVASQRHDQVLRILAGLTAARPVAISEQHLIYEQLKHADAAASKKAAKQPVRAPPLYLHKVIREITLGEEKIGLWKLVAEDVPDAGVKNVISRSVSESLLNEVDLERFRGGSTFYRYRNQYLTMGHRFVYYNIVIRMTRIMLVPEGTGVLEPLDAPLPPQNELTLLDKSGTWLIETYIRVDDGTNAKLVEQATQELVKFQKEVEGAIDLRVPDRLALDTRIKST